MKEKILIVDDEPDVLDTLKFALMMEAYDVRTASDGQEALNLLNSEAFDLVITDIKMPVMNGIDLMRHIRKTNTEVEIIALTGHATVETAVDALKSGGAFDFIKKPMEDINQLFITVEKALERRRLRQQNTELLKRIQKLSTAVEQSPSIVMITDREGRIEYVNPKFTDITGYQADEVIGHTPSILRADFYHDDYFKEMWQTITDDREWRGDFVNKKKSGEIYWERASIKALKDDHHQITHFIKVAEDITEQKRTEIALQSSERFHQAIIDSLPFSILVVDNHCRILKLNRTWQHSIKELFNKTIGVGSNYLEICGPHIGDTEVISGIQRVLNGESDSFEKEFFCKAAQRWYLLQATCLHREEKQTVISKIDITRIKQMENQLIESHKMQAIMTLAGGIAHQFNNALSAITGAVEIIKMRFPDNRDVNKILPIMESSSEKMIKLTRQLISYSRQGKYENKILCLNDVIRDTLMVMEKILNQRISVVLDLQEDIHNIKADPAQIQMVLLELLTNSAEAITGIGTIRIRSRNIEVMPFSDSDVIKAGSYVMLTIKDNGIGIEEAIKTRLFDPFFSTKFQGRGLGLAAVHGIVHNHGGCISVNSEAGIGTEIQITFPAALRSLSNPLPETAPKTEVPIVRPAAVNKIPNSTTAAIHKQNVKGKIVLIIEDNPFNMKLAEFIFSKMGFQAIQAENGTQAIHLVKNYQGSIDLVYLDMILPDMGGEDIYPIIIKERPHAKVIVCSGYSLQEAAEKIRASKSIEPVYLPKPLSPSVLKEKLQEWFVVENG